MLATMPVDQHQYPLEVPRIVTDRTCDGLVVVGRAPLEGYRRDPPGRAAGRPGRRVRGGRRLRFGRDRTTSAGPGPRSSISSRRGHRNIAILATEPQAYPEHSAATPRLRAGHRRGRADSPLHRRPVLAAGGGRRSRSRLPQGASRGHAPSSAPTTPWRSPSSRPPGRRASPCPDRLSVVGFDDIDLAGFVSPALTTMAVDKVGMGRIAVTLLAHRLELGKECVTQTFVRPTLVEREIDASPGTGGASRTQPAAALRVDPLPA